MGGIIFFPPADEPDPTLAGDLVEQRFGLSTSLVEAYDSASTSAINSLANIDFSVPMSNMDLATQLDSGTLEVSAAPPPSQIDAYVTQAQEVAFSDLETLRAQLGLVEATIEDVTLPYLDATAPAIIIPDAPTDAIPDVPTDMPPVSDPAIPAVPDITMPNEPQLLDILVPPPPELENLYFTAEMPTADLTPPEPMFAYSEQTYISDVADALRTKLYNDITLGGTGLAPEVEAAIWERALSRLNLEAAKTYRKTLSNWGAWNCEMPDGILSSALQEVLFEADRNKLDLDRDIMVKQAELAQQNTQFAITSGLVHEKQLMDYINQLNQRAFEAAKFQFGAVIDAFKLRVDVYNSQLEGYKILAQVFESRIRAELARVEMYKVQMEGAKLQGELQAQLVAIYTARVEAINTIIDLYKAQMDGAKVQIEVDRAKIDAAKAKIDAVKAQIEGVTAKYNLYQARLAGESTKAEVYSKQVAAYATQVSAVKTTADINLAKLQAITEANKDKISVLTAAIDKYKADTQYELGKDDTGAKVYTAQMAGYSAEVDREGEYLRARVDTFKAHITKLATAAELAIKEMDANLRAVTASKEIQAEALKAIANVQTQKVASALSGVSASAQIGFNASVSDAYSRSASDNSNYSRISQSSDSDNVNTNHNYYYGQ